MWCQLGKLCRKSLFWGKLYRLPSIAIGVVARVLRRYNAPFSAKFASTEAKKACQDDSEPQVAPYASYSILGPIWRLRLIVCVSVNIFPCVEQWVSIGKWRCVLVFLR
jgi:hypothetical protein